MKKMIVGIALCLAMPALSDRDPAGQAVFESAQNFFEAATPIHKDEVPTESAKAQGRCFASIWLGNDPSYYEPEDVTLTLKRVVKVGDDAVLGIHAEYSTVQVSEFDQPLDDLESGDCGYLYNYSGRHSSHYEYLLRKAEKDGKTYWAVKKVTRDPGGPEYRTYCYFTR